MIHVSVLSLLLWMGLSVLAGYILACYWLHSLGYRWHAIDCYHCGGQVGNRVGLVLVSRNTHDVLCDRCVDDHDVDLSPPLQNERDPACAGPLPGVLPRSCDHERKTK